jgi:hypothetical protein
MHAHEYALGPFVWIVTTAFSAIGGKAATVLFGNAAELLSDGTAPMPKVPAIRVGGGPAFAGDAIAIASEHLETDNRGRPRAVYVISDGDWFDTEAGVQKIRSLAELGVAADAGTQTAGGRVQRAPSGCSAAGAFRRRRRQRPPGARAGHERDSYG